ncbi:MAG TPA: nuclear transport factor 2 family protein [Gemmatimonadaceae bacterium]|nr:nuclear transport factor 2 family protein [Gemmatimonadaceae bacterium]
MRRFLCIATAALFVAPSASAQTADSVAIIAVVQKLFDGMRKKDTTSMRALFVPQARMLGLRGDSAVSASPVDGWLTSIARNPTGPMADEKTWGYEVRVDGNIAQAWMQYALYVDTTFRHCGVDAFDLVKLRGEWKIVSVMDTRRTTGCPTPPAGAR